jgi:thiamine transport system permease protein
MGLVPVICAHALINAGLVAVALRRIVQRKMGGMLELALMEGASRWKTFFNVTLPYLKADIASIFVFVFSLCLTSFSIPLVLGGVRAANFEIAIYQYIRMNGAWSQAVVLAVVQSLALFALTFFLPKTLSSARETRASVSFFAWPRLRFLIFFPAAILFVGWAVGLGRVDADIVELTNQYVPAMANTMIIGLSVGILHLGLMLLVAYLMPHAGLTRFLNGYLVPSAVIVGFALLLVPGSSDNFLLLKMILGLTIWSFPVLYRWLGHSLLSSLREQINVARILGAKPWLILWRVIFPQCAPGFFTAAGLAALWASGDFALTSILAGGQWTWALLTQDVMSTYRLNAASYMLIPLLVMGLLCYGFFRGLGRYVSG